MSRYLVNIGPQSFKLEAEQLDEMDLVENGGHYHLIIDNQSYKIEFLKQEGKTIFLKHDDNIYQVDIQDQLDQLVESMGLNTIKEVKLNEVKAPMPGIILEVLVKPGQEIQAGDALLILEAMKMENVIKADGSGTIKKIVFAKGAAVEKNQIILELE